MDYFYLVVYILIVLTQLETEMYNLFQDTFSSPDCLALVRRRAIPDSSKCTRGEGT